MSENYVEMCIRNVGLVIENPIGDNKVLIFDIDHCLYHNKEAVDNESNFIKNLFVEMSQKTEDEWLSHLSAMGLFRAVFYNLLNIHPAEFAERYEDRTIVDHIVPDPELRSLLSRIKCRKFCFTNGGKARAHKILRQLGIEDLFEVVICADTVETEFICKPDPPAFEFVENLLGITNKNNIYFFDDTPSNVKGAVTMGWNACLVDCDLKEQLKAHLDE